MEILSYAKINLCLEITGKRPDGYHELTTLMCCIELADTLRLEFGSAYSRAVCPHPDVPEDESNLCLKAAELFFKAAGCRKDFTVFIEKNIPPGSGLGGGSSNASAVLNALNLSCGSRFSPEKLEDIGRWAGADVPFFIQGRPAVAAGIGDLLRPISPPPALPLVLIYPEVPLSTAQVYHEFNFGLTKTKKINRNNTFRHIRAEELAGILYNDLEAPALKICPEIGRAKSALLAEGAAGALMSGSGSAVFGIYPDSRSARTAYVKIRESNPRWCVFLTRLRTEGSFKVLD